MKKDLPIHTPKIPKSQPSVSWKFARRKPQLPIRTLPLNLGALQVPTKYTQNPTQQPQLVPPYSQPAKSIAHELSPDVTKESVHPHITRQKPAHKKWMLIPSPSLPLSHLACDTVPIQTHFHFPKNIAQIIHTHANSTSKKSISELRYSSTLCSNPLGPPFCLWHYSLFPTSAVLVRDDAKATYSSRVEVGLLRFTSVRFDWVQCDREKYMQVCREVGLGDGMKRGEVRREEVGK